MTSRYVPYATTPTRLLWQLISDLVVIAWTTVWVLVGMAVQGDGLATVGPNPNRRPLRVAVAL